MSLLCLFIQCQTVQILKPIDFPPAVMNNDFEMYKGILCYTLFAII